MATCQLFSKKSFVVARPIPLAAPVTTAILFDASKGF
jgi:hypothetical protein